MPEEYLRSLCSSLRFMWLSSLIAAGERDVHRLDGEVVVGAGGVLAQIERHRVELREGSGLLRGGIGHHHTARGRISQRVTGADSGAGVLEGERPAIISIYGHRRRGSGRGAGELRE